MVTAASGLGLARIHTGPLVTRACIAFSIFAALWGDPAMTEFHLTYRPLGGTVLVDRTFEARSLDEAYTWASEFIAEAHDMAGYHVAFNRAAGSVTIGAGYRSRRGNFTLASTDDGVPAGIA